MRQDLELFLNGYLRSGGYKTTLVSYVNDDGHFRRRVILKKDPESDFFQRLTGKNWIEVGEIDYSSGPDEEFLTINIEEPELETVTQLLVRAIKMAIILEYVSPTAYLKTNLIAV